MISDSQAEQAVLGAILMDPPCFFRVADQLREADFTDPNRRKIWATIFKMAKAGEEIDTITVSGRCPDVAMSEVMQLSEMLSDPGNIEQYAALIIDSSIKREVSDLGRRMQVVSSDKETPRSQMLDSIEADVSRISTRGATRTVRDVGDVLAEVGKIAEAGKPETVQTGYRAIDGLLVSLEKQEFVILAARPSVGKTALAVNIALYNILLGKSVLFFSLEMSAISLMRRMASVHSGINAMKFRNGMFSRDDFAKLAKAQDDLSGLKFYIDDSSGTSPMAMISRARQIKLRHGLDLVIVDYLGLATSGEKTGNSNEEVSKISKGLKSLAKRLDVPALVLCQLSRAPEKENREPILSDLRDSGSLEQDADVVMFLNTKGTTETSRLVSVRVAKARNGPVGSGILAFMLDTQKFVSYNGGMEKP